MKRSILAFSTIVAVFFCSLACAMAAAGSYSGALPARVPIDGRTTVTLDADKFGHILLRGITLSTQTVTANTTLTTTSPGVIFANNATAVITLANATTAGVGYTQRVINVASGNVSVASASLIDGASSINATTVTPASVVSDGTAWHRLAP
jgi:hypothetical protein